MAGTLQNRAQKHQARVDDDKALEKKIQSFGKFLQTPGMQAQLRRALPKIVTPDRLARIVLTQVRANPKLMLCTQESMLGSVMECAQLGLEPGVLGQAWIIPYGQTATLVVGYQGMCQLAWRSRLVKSITARVVMDGYDVLFDLGAERPSHVMRMEPTEDGLTHAYALVQTTSGGLLWDVMTRAEIDRIRERSKASENGPWVTDYLAMARKTVVRRIMKLAPQSPELTRVEQLNTAADIGSPQGIDFEFDSGVTLEAEVIPEREDGEGPRLDG